MLGGWGCEVDSLLICKELQIGLVTACSRGYSGGVYISWSGRGRRDVRASYLGFVVGELGWGIDQEGSRGSTATDL